MVHPDFFQSNEKKKRLNEQSFAKLNQLLDWLVEFEHSQGIAPPIPFTIPTVLKFHLKTDKESKIVSSTFNLPGGILKYNVAAEYMDDFIVSLLYQAGIPLPRVVKKHMKVVRETRKKNKANQHKGIRAVKPVATIDDKSKEDSKYRKVAGDLREELRDAMFNNILKVDTAKLEKGEWVEDVLPSIETLIDEQRIVFSANLQPDQIQFALFTLKKHLKEMKYDVWKNFGIYIDDNDYSSTRLPGTFCIPFSFQVGEFLEHLNDHLSHLKQESDMIQSSIDELEKLTLSASKDYNIRGITFHPHLNPPLQLDFMRRFMNDVMPDISVVLDKNIFSKLQFYVSPKDEYELDYETFSVHVPFSVNTPSLLSFCATITEPTLESFRKESNLHYDQIYELFNVANSIVQTHNIGTLDVSSRSDELSIGDILSFLYRLRECGFLKMRFDMSDYTFILSPKDALIETDPQAKTVTLPLEFDIGLLFSELLAIYKADLAKDNVTDAYQNVVKNEAIAKVFKEQQVMEEQYRVAKRDHLLNLLESALKLQQSQDEYESSTEETISDEDIQFLMNEFESL